MHLLVNEGLDRVQIVKAVGADVDRLALEPEALNDAVISVDGGICNCRCCSLRGFFRSL